MTATFCYVTTACRVSEDIVPPDGGDLWCRVFCGTERTTVQSLFPQICQDIPQRISHGHRRQRIRPVSPPRNISSKHQCGFINIRQESWKVSMLQPQMETSWNTIAARRSSKATSVFIPREHDGISVHELCVDAEPQDVHLVQQARDPDGDTQAKRIRQTRLYQTTKEGSAVFHHRTQQPRGGRRLGVTGEPLEEVEQTAEAQAMETRQTAPRALQALGTQEEAI